MWTSLCPELHLVVTIICIKITESLSASGGSSLSLVSTPQVYAPQPRSASFLAGNSRLSPMINPAPYQYTSNGISRTYYPSYMGYPVYPRSSSPTGYSVPSGATALEQRSYSNYGSPNSYSAYPLSYANNNVAALSPSYTSSSSAIPLQASVRSFAPYGTDLPYRRNYYKTNIGNYAISSPRADPAEPDDPTDTDSSRRTFASVPMAPRFNSPSVPTNNPGMNSGISNPVINTGAPRDGGFMQNFMANQKMGAQNNNGFLSSNVPVATPLDARISLGNGATGDYGVGSNYAAAAPAGASYTGPASSYAQATGYGKEGYAESSPNTAYGAKPYNPKYGGNSYPSYYGATPKSYGLGNFPTAAFSPFYFYYPVAYGYDQGEQTVMPTGGIPLIGYKRRYGYRHGPFYGYGIYVDYPPYFGFGKVKDGWGSDPEADLMAATALDQGAGASASQSIQASSGNQNAQQTGGYGSSGNGYGGQSGYGQTAGYGSSPSTGSYGAASSAVASPYGMSSTPVASQYNGQMQQPYAAPSAQQSYSAPSAQSYSAPSLQSYSAPSAQSYTAPVAASSQYAAPSAGNSQYSYFPASNDQSQYGTSQNYGSGSSMNGQQYGPSSAPQAYSGGNNGAQYGQGSSNYNGGK